MRVLFDQGTPVPLRNALSHHVVETAYERGWQSLTNSELLEVGQRPQESKRGPVMALSSHCANASLGINWYPVARARVPEAPRGRAPLILA